MLWLKRILGFILAIVLVLMTLIFVFENQQALVINLLGYTTPQLPTALFVVLAFVVGGLLGIALGLVVSSRAKFQLKAAHARLVRHENELNRLRSEALLADKRQN